MEERDKHKLEGLLKARSANMGRRRRSRLDPVVEAPGFTPTATVPESRPPDRSCGDCGAGILARRLRAMPSATRCLDCQRAFEQARGTS